MTEAVAAPQTVTWEVTGHFPAGGVDGKGQFGNGYQVNYKASNGIDSSVFVSQAEYDDPNYKEIVRERIIAKLGKEAEINSLKG